MKILVLFALSLTLPLLSIEKLRVYDEFHPNTPLIQTSEFIEIGSILNSIGVLFEKWNPTQPVAPSALENEIFSAYAKDIEKLKKENNYQTVDIVRMVADSPKKEELRNKFLNEHTHTENEVRLFVEGSALFYMHTEGKIFIVLCEKDDLISIPAHYRHWFDMGPSPHFTAIRFFTDASGWVANFTNDPISEKFPRFETSVTANMITQFSIPNGVCLKSYPCQHARCKISLFDGREKTICLNGSEIQALIQSIAPDKIHNPLGAHHFQNFKTTSINVDSLLSKIFKPKIEKIDKIINK
jgi:1,2-dihydroxy-3-keto-5-methylthiopentene dioxygenase